MASTQAAAGWPGAVTCSRSESSGVSRV
jgi:hypothetical protein